MRCPPRRSALDDATVWREALALPDTLHETLGAPGIAELAELLAAPSVRRVVATGNGASWYAALALWLASLAAPARGGPDVLALPGGLLASGAVEWREGDVLLAFSSSGEFRDVVEAVEAESVPRPFALVSATPDSTLGRAAGTVVHVSVRSQDAITHTQGYVGATVAALAAWARVTGDAQLERAVARAPELAARSLDAVPSWVATALDGLEQPAAALVFAPGPAWAAALEAALLLGEIALVPAHGTEVREGATTGMYPLAPGQLALSLPAGAPRLTEEAEAVCARRGATVLRAPGDLDADPRLAAVSCFAAPLGLAVGLAQRSGLDPDAPGWYGDYLATARRAPG
jgi:fructoselysine-6-P-deglycase FrlB-like protein